MGEMILEKDIFIKKENSNLSYIVNKVIKINSFCVLEEMNSEDKDELYKDIIDILQISCPEWKDISKEEAQIQQLAGGMTNIIFVVTKPSGIYSKVLVRIYGEGTDDFFERKKEIILFKLLSNQNNMGIQLLGEFLNGRIERFITGKTCTAKDIRNPCISASIARKLKKFHQIELPIMQSSNHVLYRINHLYNKLKQLSNSLPDHFINSIHLDKIAQDIQHFERMIQFTLSPIVLCHFDLQYGNIMMMNEDIVFIDFEYTCYAPRGFDIGNHFCEWSFNYHLENSHVGDYSNYPSYEEQKYFCQQYLKDDQSYDNNNNSIQEKEVEQLIEEANKYSLASHLFWGLWGYIQSTQSKIDFNFKEYANGRFEAFRNRITL